MILVAPTSFKGTHSAAAVAEAMARAARTVSTDEIIELPVSDGGPGLIDALLHVEPSLIATIEVEGPFGDPVRARVLTRGEDALLESADACGLHLVRATKRDPMRATTAGVGTLMYAASATSRRVIVGLGGSATLDGGLGMARALGWSLLDRNDKPVPAGGQGVLDLARVVAPAGKAVRDVVALADVRNPLFGPAGAARVFGPQKGASAEDVERLDEGLARMAEIILRDVGVDVASIEGGGAAGGLGAGLVAFADARIVSGSEWVFERLGLDALLRRATVIITGEGAYDAQSTMGKITGEVIARAGGVPVLLIAGSAEGDLPPNVTAMPGKTDLSLNDIEERVRTGLPGLLSQ